MENKLKNNLLKSRYIKAAETDSIGPSPDNHGNRVGMAAVTAALWVKQHFVFFQIVLSSALLSLGV